MSIFYKIFKKLFAKNLLNQSFTRVIVFALVFNLIFGISFYLAEQSAQPELTLVDSIWWAMVTMTTVGYGDYSAQTFAGRFLISYPCMLLGIGIIGYLVGIVAETMLERGSRKKKGLLKISMKDHLIICNFPGEQKILRVWAEIKRAKAYADCEIVLVTNKIDDLPAVLLKEKFLFVKGDPVSEETLMQANVLNCAGVVILAENINDSDSDTKTCAIGTKIEMIERESNIPIRVVVEMGSMDNAKMMQRSKVDGIVSADGVMDALIAQEFLYPGLQQVFHEVLSNVSGSQFYILETRFKGLAFGELQHKAVACNQNIQIVGLNRAGQSVMNPDKKEIVTDTDKLIVLADSRNDFEKFEKEIVVE